MKLTLNRREEREEKPFTTVIMYYLDIKLDLTPEEIALIETYEWDEIRIYCGTLMWFTVGTLIEQARSARYASVEELADGESQVIEIVRKLQQQLDAAASITSEGSWEIDL